MINRILQSIILIVMLLINYDVAHCQDLSDGKYHEIASGDWVSADSLKVFIRNDGDVSALWILFRVNGYQRIDDSIHYARIVADKGMDPDSLVYGWIDIFIDRYMFLNKLSDPWLSERLQDNLYNGALHGEVYCIRRLSRQYESDTELCHFFDKMKECIY